MFYARKHSDSGKCFMRESIATAADTEVSHHYSWLEECGFKLFSTGVQTSAEIEELSLRTPRPVAIYLCESEATAKGSCLCDSVVQT
ncbi:hypothetical protein ACIQXF_22785 [Lysinibacillus sp. NPDC097231]|uniref:hypothetical protein n=1 Tax=Lysinibacillus sp. NPDC097231 TaxID=3364142 RepID=UPI003824592C